MPSKCGELGSAIIAAPSTKRFITNRVDLEGSASLRSLCTASSFRIVDLDPYRIVTMLELPTILRIAGPAISLPFRSTTPESIGIGPPAMITVGSEYAIVTLTVPADGATTTGTAVTVGCVEA